MNIKEYLTEVLKLQVWDKREMHRIYLNTKTLCDLYELKCSTYSSGRVSSATLNGDKITNSRATRIITMFQFSKFYYDLSTKNFESNLIVKRKRIHKSIVKAIKINAGGY